MAISKLTIKKVASYDENGVVLNDLKKLNFFFGYNGSGKSTIARYLHNISLGIEEQEIEYASCLQQGYNSNSHVILVFDEDFKRENFFEKDVLRGIFSLNRSNEKIDNAIKEYEVQIQNLKESEYNRDKRYEKIQLKQNEVRRQIINYCFEQRRQFESLKKEKIPYGGNKERHFLEIKNYIDKNHLSNSFGEICNEYKRLYDSNIANISLNINLDIWTELLQIESDLKLYLKEIIVGNNDVDIAGLINSLNISSWVEVGIEILDKTNGNCPFCQQKIIDLGVLKEKFSIFFDRNFKDKVERIKTLGNQYYLKVKEIKETIREIAKIFTSNRDCLSILDILTTITDNNLQAIREKIANPNEIKEIETIAQLTLSITKLKDDIDKNNTDFLNLTTLKQKWLEDCWIYMANNSKAKIEKYEKQNAYYNKILTINNLLKIKNEGLISFYRERIDNLRKQTVNTTEAVEEINKILKHVGFDDFSIKERKSDDGISQYFLKRKNSDGLKVFKSLSEGEKTFISFLYFYQLCIGTCDIENDAAKKKIIIIDDPVSSLDSQILFIVTTLIHKLAQRKGSNGNDKKEFFNSNIEQIFVFTHNFYFYKEVSLSRRPICSDYFHYKILKQKSITTITGNYNSTITDDYTLMWTTLKEVKSIDNIDKSINLMLANLMRRILDTYIEFIGMKKSGSSITWSAIDKIDINSPEYIVEAAFISCINDESHSISPLDDEYYNKIIREHPSILFTAFKNIFRHIGKEHYEMMMNETYDN